MRSIGPAVTREQSPAFLRNSNGRLDFPGPTHAWEIPRTEEPGARVQGVTKESDITWRLNSINTQRTEIISSVAPNTDLLLVNENVLPTADSARKGMERFLSLDIHCCQYWKGRWRMALDSSGG